MADKVLIAEETDILAEKAQKGDAQAFAKIYDMYVDQIYRYIFFRVDKDEALDLTENVFLKVWENIKSYKAGKRYFSSWIYKIAHNLVVDSYRLKKHVEPLESYIPDEKRESDPVFLTERKLTRDTLIKAIGKLRKKYQQVILLKYINEMDNEEIARIMNKSEGGLRILKYRALKALRLVLEEMNVKY